MTTINLINDDCLKAMQDLDENSIDLLFCDLPYGVLKCGWDCQIDLEQFWIQANRVCKDSTPIICTCTTKFGNTLINSNPKHFRYDMVWVKSNLTGFLNSRERPLRRHEMVYIFYKSSPKIYTNNIDIHHKKVVKTSSNRTQTESTAYSCVSYNSNSKYEPRLPNSLLEFQAERGLHPTQKPVGLMEFFLKYFTKVDDVVLDPTMGSGSTGVACQNMDRKFVGIERDPDIFTIAQTRLNK